MKRQTKKQVWTIFGLIFVIFSCPFLINNNRNIKVNDINLNKAISTSSTPTVQWFHIWGGDGDEIGENVAVDLFGNVYVAGHTDSFGAGNTDMFLVKFNPLGYLEWNRTWGGSGNDFGIDIAIGASSSVYVAGSTESFGAGNTDMFLVKFNPLGDIEWNHTWGGSGDDGGYGMTIDASENLYVTGLKESFGANGYDMCLVKFNPAGGVVWNHTWGGRGIDMGIDVAVDTSGNAYVVGTTTSFGAGYDDICLVKFNPMGGVVWNYTWGGGGYDYGYGIALDSSGKAYVAGHTTSFGAGSTDICLVKFNPLGDIEWNRTWGGDRNDDGYDIVLDTSGDVCITGSTNSFGLTHPDMCLVKFNSIGVEWNHTWGGNESERGHGVALDLFGNAYVCGYTTSFGASNDDMFLVKFIGITSEDSNQVPDPLLFIIIGSIIGGIAGGSGIIAIVIVGIVRPRRKRARASLAT
ncbi:MAG: SBBP repeat-containing protein [Promethearchaeota archaeon]